MPEHGEAQVAKGQDRRSTRSPVAASGQANAKPTTEAMGMAWSLELGTRLVAGELELQGDTL